MTNIWVCGDCRSINRLSADRCYKCRAPRPPAGEEMAAASRSPLSSQPEPQDGLSMPDRPAISGSAAAAVNPSARIATLPAAVLGIALMVLVVGLRLMLTRLSLGATERILSGEEVPATDSEFAAAVGLLSPLLGVIAIGWLGIWASLVIRNVPLLGGGWPRFTPGQVFLEHVIPGWNVLRMPAVYREIQARLSRTGRANDPLIVAWVVFNIAAVLVVRPIGSTVASLALTPADAIGVSATVSYLSIGLQGLAILIIAMLIAEIEGNQADRAREIRGEITSKVPTLRAAGGVSRDARAAVVGRSVTVVGGRRARTRARPEEVPEPAHRATTS